MPTRPAPMARSATRSVPPRAARGCTVLEMATAERPWGDAAYGDLAAAVRRLAAAAAAPPVPGRAPDACRALVAACTRRERAERPEAGLLLRHEFVALP